MESTTKRRTLSDDVLDTLRERIVSGELEAGTPLRQNTLAKELAVSPIPVREALVQLEAEGLAVSKPHHGSVVASLSLEDITEVFEIRAYLEVPLLRRAIDHITARMISDAKIILENFDDALKRQRVQEYGKLNWEFHALLYRPANRPQTVALAHAFHMRADRYTRVQLRNTDGGAKSQKEHRQILELCRKHDADAAAALLEKHILTAGKSLTNFLASLDQAKREGK
jgi:DNA-binding GntR family transcriptional regulator